MTDFQPVSETTIRDSNLVLQAALDGQGAALGVFPFVKNDVHSARLLKPFDIDLIPHRSFYLLSRPSSPRTREVSVVQNWLLDEAARSLD